MTVSPMARRRGAGDSGRPSWRTQASPALTLHPDICRSTDTCPPGLSTLSSETPAHARCSRFGSQCTLLTLPPSN